MTRTVFPLLMLSASLLTACASTKASEQFVSDDCEAISMLFKDQSLNASSNITSFKDDFESDKSEDKFTWPWGRGGTNEDRVSKERAALRKAHNRKGCAE